jgi:hypothetical protein
VKYAIYPPIGLARIGNSTDAFFIGPERAGSRGSELKPDGTEVEVTSFKDTTHRVKPQAARFHVFEVPDDGSAPRPAQLPSGATIRWSVRLVNKKDAINRPGSPPDPPIMPTAKAGREDRVIDTQIQQIAGVSAAARSLVGKYRQEDVRLGDLRTDSSQRLLVVGAEGRSSSPTGAAIGGSFYTNTDWFDDVGDGPVTAEVVLPGGASTPCTPAWVIVAPPDFAPGCQGVVTLYDVILQVALDQSWTTLPARPSFVDHIRPMLERARNLRWVNNGAMWPLISDNWTDLANPASAMKSLREENAGFVRAAEDQLHDFSLRDWQNAYLDRWIAGDFDPGPLQVAPSAVLTRAVLDGSVGQGFFPGIEAGIIVTIPTLYSQPFDFRFDHARVAPGDITALMALPWQADFLKCNGSWWPAQRPDLAQQANGQRPAWLRPSMNHKRLVADVMKLGVITPGVDAAGQEAFIETGRDPQLG